MVKVQCFWLNNQGYNDALNHKILKVHLTKRIQEKKAVTHGSSAKSLQACPTLRDPMD